MDPRPDDPTATPPETAAGDPPATVADTAAPPAAPMSAAPHDPSATVPASTMPGPPAEVVPTPAPAEPSEVAPGAEVVTAPTPEGVPVTAVATAGASRARWLVGGGIAVAAVAGLILAATMLGARPMPEVFKYLPSDSAVVVELRPELPGDQRQNLGNFLAHFPGFEDQSTLDAKIDEVLERITREGSSGAVNYATQVKPLLGGPMAVAIDAASLKDSMSGGTPAGFLVVATTDGTATCDSVFGPTTVASTHRDVEIRTVDDSLSLACAIHDRQLLVGSESTIGAGLDARLDGKGIDGSSVYRAAHAKLEGDQVASIYMDIDVLFDAMTDLAGSMGQELAALPQGGWVIEGFRVTGDALVVDAYGGGMTAPAPPSGAPTTAPAAESRFAAVLPSDTLGYLEVHGFGALMETTIATLRADPDQAEAVQSLDQALAMLGGADNLVGWIEEAGLAVIPTGDSVGGAILFRGTSAEKAAAQVTQIRNLLVLASTGSDITISDEDHNGVTITKIDLGDVSGLLGQFGAPATPGVGNVRLELQLTARDDLVIFGIGEGVAERILDVQSSGSLASAGTYDHLIEIAGATNDVQMYVALDASLGFVEGFLSGQELGSYETELKPYLEHLAGVGFTTRGSGSAGHARVVFTVK